MDQLEARKGTWTNGKIEIGKWTNQKAIFPSQLTAATAQTRLKAVYTVHCTQFTDGRSFNKCGGLIYTRFIRFYVESSLEGRHDSRASGFRAGYSLNCVGVGETSSCLPPSGGRLGPLACSLSGTISSFDYTLHCTALNCTALHCTDS